MPGAIASGTPMSDITKTGDTFTRTRCVDNVLVSTEGFCDAATRFYANGHDFKDPLLSPVYGDMSGFPPTILTSGTRDLLLSNTVRVHRKLRQPGIESGRCRSSKRSRTRNTGETIAFRRCAKRSPRLASS